MDFDSNAAEKILLQNFNAGCFQEAAISYSAIPNFAHHLNVQKLNNLNF